MKNIRFERFRPIKFLGLSVMGVLFAATSYAQSLNSSWKQELNTALQQFSDCQQAGNPAECSRFIGESLNKIYKVNDFYSQKSGRYMIVNEISSYLKDAKSWTLLGHSYEQTTLATAQEFANAKKAVVAVYTNAAGIGHVVVITPGQLQSSGSWGLNVPNVASFLPSQPEKSFVDKGLSFAFGKSMMKDILIYARVY